MGFVFRAAPAFNQREVLGELPDPDVNQSGAGQDVMEELMDTTSTTRRI